MVGGQAPKAIRSVECYDFTEDKWHQLAEMPSRRCRCGMSKNSLKKPISAAAALSVFLQSMPVTSDINML